MRLLEIPAKHYAFLHKAVEAAVIRAALDGRAEMKAAGEDTLAALTSAHIATLPEAPSRAFYGEQTVNCELTLEELTDIQLALECYLKNLQGRAAYLTMWALTTRRLMKLHERITSTIKLNPLRKR